MCGFDCSVSTVGIAMASVHASRFLWYLSLLLQVYDLTLSYFRTYIRNPKTVVTPVRIYIYVHGLCDRNMGLSLASHRHFTVAPREVFTCFRSAAGSHFTACLPTEEKWSLLRVVRCFWRVLENYDCRTKFNSSLGMEHNGELYGFSAMKVKLVDSFI